MKMLWALGKDKGERLQHHSGARPVLGMPGNPSAIFLSRDGSGQWSVVMDPIKGLWCTKQGQLLNLGLLQSKLALQQGA